MFREREKFLLLLSGEHSSLPYSEVNAILESEGIEFREVERFDQLLVIYTQSDIGRFLGQRAAYVMEGGRLILHASPSLKELQELCRRIDWRFLEGRRFGVRISRVKEYWRALSSVEIERLVGGIIKEVTDARVDLRGPEVWIRGIITDGGVFLYTLDFKTDRRAFARRKPKTRPFFHPGVLEPKLARVFINLSRVRGGDIFLDPFCGTGGFLIEAALMGLRTFGVELDERMILGAARNLRYYGLDVDLILGDARRCPLRKVDGIATDPPYGRGTSTKGESVRDILIEFMEEAYRTLKDGGWMCIAAPHETRIQKIATETGFRVHESHNMRVHKSLTRCIVVVKKYAG
ncbi:MAG: THUMP domain-containing protein [Candidatus Methanomethylicaceae archaeon]